jgi:flagellar hook-length control protein FliK
MDLLNNLPVAKPVQPRDFQSGVSRDNRDNRVEETGGLSFSGFLARNQENTELKSTSGQKPIQGEETPQQAKGAPAAEVEKSTLATQALKIKLAQAEVKVDAPAGTSTPAGEPGPAISGTVMPSQTVEGEATTEVKPTGGDGQATSVLDLSALKPTVVAGEKAASEASKMEKPQGSPAHPHQENPGPAPKISVPQGQMAIPREDGSGTTPDLARPSEPMAAQKPELPHLVSQIVTGSKENSAPGVVQGQVQAPVNENAVAPMERPAAEIPGTGMDTVQMTYQAPEGQVETAVENPQDQPADQVEAPTMTDIQGAEAQTTGQEDQAAAEDNHEDDQKPIQAQVQAQPVPTKEASTENVVKEGTKGEELEPTLNEAAPAAARPRVLTQANPASGRVDLLEQGRQIRRQVIQELSSSLDGRIGNEKITLQLNPEKLGQVEIQFLARGNDLSIAISASSNDAEQAIREGIKELAEGIADKSARWQQVDIKVDQRGQDQDKNDSRQDNRRDQSRRDGRQNQEQHPRQQAQSGGPDWASLRQEG